MLTDAECRNAICPPDKKRARFACSGGLYLEVAAGGSKRWFWKYRRELKEYRLALGSYPAIGPKEARRLRDVAKLQKTEGKDPIEARKVQRLKASNPNGDSVQVVALEWYEKNSPEWSHHHADRTKRQLEKDLFPWIGERKMAHVEPVELLAAIRKTEARGAIETAHRCLMVCGQIWRYAVATGRANRDIAADLKGALTPFRGKHFGAITDPQKLAPLLRSIQGYKGGPIVRAALQLAPILFTRPGELRAAEWAEMDLDAGLWTIPASRMKRTKEGKENGDPHLVPLPRQAVAILRDLFPLTGHGRMVFPGQRDHDRPLSENSVRSALIALGYTSDVQTWHGFRSTARTILDEVLELNPLVAEAQLAHAVKDANGRAYNRTQYMKQRAEMMQTWADYLDALRIKGQ